ncbi:DUF397 domain-containing protein [Streptomyces wuyuanensis]|uniref:DUF397 domain-containing protein n=1 Tax=Streptomyces wuyuanensis TaxID=1196353 RepID=A0A1G9X7Q4_9ACTN|nr:DUF397 domain-containing protein [Streptomyces wuyuanensis]SDM92758.1 protein of unknown function [Streptomyces wuyuanensis]
MNPDLVWFKSSYSDNEGGACLEVAYAWRISSYSTNEGGSCVEIAACPHTVHVRDSKVPDGPMLSVAPASWAAFVATTAVPRPAR